MSSTDYFPEFAAKMETAGIASPTIQSFAQSYRRFVSGDDGLIPENTIEPVSELPTFAQIGCTGDETLLTETVVLKLNGGLGTGMGLDRPKSLLKVKDELTFLDLIVRQILHLRKAFATPLELMFMNSFATSEETLQHLRNYPEIGDPKRIELMQSLVPKVDAKTLRPAKHTTQPQLEWCPPGHGDLYPSLIGTGWLDRLIHNGVRYLFVSNADNLGATLDLGLLTYFAKSGSDFLMEVTERTEMDKKGGHLARKSGGRFVLRESAQCPENEFDSFQDIGRHRFFNTNNLWLRLDSLKNLAEKFGGTVPLPLITNSKNVDPRDKNSPPVVQLETAMGAAIENFERASAINVPRTRFAPVKTTSDLLILRSDAYEITKEWHVKPHAELAGGCPIVELDSEHFKFVDQLDSKLAGIPSLKRCQFLRVRGPIRFSPGVVLEGRVEILNRSGGLRDLPPGTYRDAAIEFKSTAEANQCPSISPL